MTDVQTVALTRLESIALQCAAQAVIDSAPTGSPGEPLVDALRKLTAADGLDIDTIERGAEALAREQYPSTRWPDEFENADNLRADAEAVLAAALSPTEGPSDG